LNNFCYLPPRPLPEERLLLLPEERLEDTLPPPELLDTEREGAEYVDDERDVVLLEEERVDTVGVVVRELLLGVLVTLEFEFEELRFTVVGWLLLLVCLFASEPVRVLTERVTFVLPVLSLEEVVNRFREVFVEELTFSREEEMFLLRVVTPLSLLTDVLLPDTLSVDVLLVDVNPERVMLPDREADAKVLLLLPPPPTEALPYWLR